MLDIDYQAVAEGVFGGYWKELPFVQFDLQNEISCLFHSAETVDKRSDFH